MWYGENRKTRHPPNQPIESLLTPINTVENILTVINVNVCVHLVQHHGHRGRERDTHLINKHINMSDSEELGQIIWMQTLWKIQVWKVDILKTVLVTLQKLQKGHKTSIKVLNKSSALCSKPQESYNRFGPLTISTRSTSYS